MIPTAEQSQSEQNSVRQSPETLRMEKPKASFKANRKIKKKRVELDQFCHYEFGVSGDPKFDDVGIKVYNAFSMKEARRKVQDFLENLSKLLQEDNGDATEAA